MDTDQEQTAPEADDTTDSGSPAQTVRVPNVSPNAKSGLDHTIIGSNALEDAYEGDDSDAEPEGDPEDPDVPQGDLGAALAWVGEAEDSDTAQDRADRVWKVYAAGENNDSLAAALREAVHGKPADPGAHVADPAATGEGTSDATGDAPA